MRANAILIKTTKEGSVMPKASVTSDGLVDTWGRKNRKLHDKKCKNCDVIFRPKSSSSKYCSRPCMWANNGGHNKKKESWWRNSKGYIEGKVWIDDHTQINVKQHRWVMENHLGEKLDPRDDVHHINGIKDDNRIENLEVIAHGKHTEHHNLEREYKNGYKMDISDRERNRRSDQAKAVKPWLGSKHHRPKARGEHE